MAEFQIVAGDWGDKKKGEIKGHTLIVRVGPLRSEKFDMRKDVDKAELQTEEEIKKLTWARVFWLGIFSLWARKDKSKFHFAVYLKDGRKFLGVSDRKTWLEVQQAAF